jgi:MinD-like ATPase involved in chromosome partitioning or flagellar assembly
MRERNQMQLYYTRFDVEQRFRIGYPTEWHPKWIDVDVYPDEINIIVKDDFSEEDIQASMEHISSMFTRQSVENGQFTLDIEDKKLFITYDKNPFQTPPTDRANPLFADIPFIIDVPSTSLPTPLIAFHSFKGGVGRTLSLLAFVKSLSGMNPSNPLKALIVDADIEAPGLTWLAEQRGLNTDMSFLDVLNIMHEAVDKSEQEKAIKFITKKIQESSLRIPVGNREVDHYFLPVYRSDFQLMLNGVRPADFLSVLSDKWAIPELFSSIGNALGIDVVLVDLRAGFSEYAAPFIADPRVRRVFVTSTSLQSRKGLLSVLSRLQKTLIQSQFPSPTVLLSMVPDEISQSRLAEYEIELFSVLMNTEEGDDLLSGEANIIRLPFDPGLVHLEGFDTIDSRLSRTSMSNRIDNLVREWFPAANITTQTLTVKSRDEFLQSLVKRTSEMENAESNSISSFLTTIPIRNLAKKYHSEIPNCVVLGAKGSGKTFVFLQLLRAGTWENFVSKVNSEMDDNITEVFPLLKSRNFNERVVELRERFEELNRSFGIDIDINELEKRSDAIDAFRDTELESQWKTFWRRIILDSLGQNRFETIDALNKFLEAKNRRILFIVDGLEDQFQKISESKSEQAAVRALCQGIVEELQMVRNSRIGILVYGRRDIVENAVVQNWGQFYSLYQSFELKWTHVEALRLALWLSSQINESLKPIDVPIEDATFDLLESRLELLWGSKLGTNAAKEAYSVNWILAALSDLNEQLQARDIVRFLRYAAEGSLRSELFTDRYLIPSAIRRAIQPCSEQKIKEISQEISRVNEIFTKLQSHEVGQRQIPFDLKQFDLSIEDAKVMTQQGYLVKLEDGYYMPEIIRHGLKFSLTRGARPKVLALLKGVRNKG